MIVQISPLGSMDLLSKAEVDRLQSRTHSDIYATFRKCILATLNAGIVTDNTEALLEDYTDFDVKLIATERGIKLELINPPPTAFVDDKLIQSIHVNLYAVLRDILFVSQQMMAIQGLYPVEKSPLEWSQYTTNVVFSILRNANALHVGKEPNLVVCWGGHSVNEIEYEYAKSVGLELGLRQLDICTGCGAGVMEAPMKGAAIGHAQQRYKSGRFIGMTESSIISAEPPNALVNELIIMPDIEKRLEAFVRMAHSIVIFPGGPGTAEELLYILGILLSPENKKHTLPLILTGPKESADYFEAIDQFIRSTLGETATDLYEIIIDDAQKVAKTVKQGIQEVKMQRLKSGDAYSFHWGLSIPSDFQQPFEPTHENMARLNLHKNQPIQSLAADLRRAFSGIVAGNIKAFGIQQIAEKGPYQIQGDPNIMAQLDQLLQRFVAQHRMKLPSDQPYVPCYRILNSD